jgi:hypothetical protein
MLYPYQQFAPHISLFTTCSWECRSETNLLAWEQNCKRGNIGATKLHEEVGYMSRLQMAPKCGPVVVAVHLFMISALYTYTAQLALRFVIFLYKSWLIFLCSFLIHKQNLKKKKNRNLTLSKVAVSGTVGSL